MKLLSRAMNSFELSYAPKGQEYILKLTVPENQKGIIYRVTAVLFAHGWDIKEAIFETIGDGLVKDIFIIQSINGISLSSDGLALIREDLLGLFREDFSVIDYIEKFPDLPLLRPSKNPPIVQIYNPTSSDSTVLDIKTQDRSGLLFEISQILYLFDIDILSVTARTEDGIVRDSFLLRRDISEKLTTDTMEKIKQTLVGIL
jgi:[protein-PII] uridylyltransferase